MISTSNIDFHIITVLIWYQYIFFYDFDIDSGFYRCYKSVLKLVLSPIILIVCYSWSIVVL